MSPVAAHAQLADLPASKELHSLVAPINVRVSSMQQQRRANVIIASSRACLSCKFIILLTIYAMCYASFPDACSSQAKGSKKQPNCSSVSSLHACMIVH
jgi:hypothetical protein